jgi:hypothetical protein
MPESPYNPSDLDEALSPVFIRGSQMLAVSMVVSPLIWLGLGLYTSHEARPGGQAPTVLAAVLSVLGVLQFAFSSAIADWSLQRADVAAFLENGMQQGRGGRVTGRVPVLQVMLRKHHLIRLALNEAVGVYGLLIAFMAGHLLWEQPLWMLSLAACVLASAANALLWPNADFYRGVFSRTLEGRP